MVKIIGGSLVVGYFCGKVSVFGAGVSLRMRWGCSNSGAKNDFVFCFFCFCGVVKREKIKLEEGSNE